MESLYVFSKFFALLKISKTANELVSEITKNKIIPLISRKIKTQIHASKINQSFTEYYKRTAKKTSYVNTIVFQNQPKFISELYVPLELITKNDTDIKFFLDDKFEIKNLLSFDKILIVDDAGMGKSTCSKWLFLNCLNQELLMPFFIELRHLDKDKDIFSLLKSELNLKENVFSDDDLNEILAQENVVFFLDGLDEINAESKAVKTKIWRDVNSFIQKYDKALFVLTSRPDDSLNGLCDFCKFSLRGFEPEEAYQLIRKYDSKGKYSDQIIEEVRKNESNTNITELLRNPLTVSLLFTSFLYKPILSFNQVQFYDDIFDALFERHDYSKGDAFFRPKKSQLNKVEFINIVSRLGIDSALKLNKVTYSYSELAQMVSDAKGYFNLEFDIASFIEDLKTTVPLFTEDGANIKWAHKTFQEFYAAKYIRYHLNDKDKKTKILKRLSDNNGYYKIIDFYFDTEPNYFKSYILKDYLISLKENILLKNQKYSNEKIAVFEAAIELRKAKGVSCYFDDKKVSNFVKIEKKLSAEYPDFKYSLIGFRSLTNKNGIYYFYHESRSFRSSTTFDRILKKMDSLWLEKKRPEEDVIDRVISYIPQKKLITINNPSDLYKEYTKVQVEELIDLFTYISHLLLGFNLKKIEDIIEGIIIEEDNERKFDIDI